MRNLFAALFLTFSLCAGADARPEFVLGSEVAGGQLTWCGHTVAPCLDAPVPADDHIVEDSAAKTLSLGLHWNTTPDAATGECLAAIYYWRIAQAELVASRYRIAVERSGPAEIVFVLAPASGGAAVLRSPRCPIAKAFVGTFEDVARLTTRIDPQTLLSCPETGDCCHAAHCQRGSNP